LSITMIIGGIAVAFVLSIAIGFAWEWLRQGKPKNNPVGPSATIKPAPKGQPTAQANPNGLPAPKQPQSKPL